MSEFPPIAEQVKRCPIEHTFSIVGKKFTLLILRNMMNFGHTRFNEFLTIEGINPKTLSIRLREMHRNGLIDRHVYHETPVRIEYCLTERGKALWPVLEQMMVFSIQHYPEEIFKDGKARTVQEFYAGWERAEPPSSNGSKSNNNNGCSSNNIRKKRA